MRTNLVTKNDIFSINGKKYKVVTNKIFNTNAQQYRVEFQDLKTGKKYSKWVDELNEILKQHRSENVSIFGVMNNGQ